MTNDFLRCTLIAICLGGFICISMLALYQQLKRAVLLDPRSKNNQKIVTRFATEQELLSFNRRYANCIVRRANADLHLYHAKLRHAVNVISADQPPITLHPVQALKLEKLDADFAAATTHAKVNPVVMVAAKQH